VSLEKKPSTALSQDAEVGVAHLRMLVGRIVVDDRVDHFSHRDLLLDRVEEADELLMAMACMLRPMTVSRTLRAANSVVVP
jgi:hypothetical protein